MKGSRDLGIETEWLPEDVHIMDGVDPAPQFDNTPVAPRWTMGLLPYFAATIFFIFAGAGTILGADLWSVHKMVSSSVGKAQAFTPSSAPKPESWADTPAAFRRAIANSKEDEAEPRKLIEQLRERLKALSLRLLPGAF